MSGREIGYTIDGIIMNVFYELFYLFITPYPPVIFLPFFLFFSDYRKIIWFLSLAYPYHYIFLIFIDNFFPFGEIAFYEIKEDLEMSDKATIQIMRVFIALLIFSAANMLLYLTYDVLEMFNIKIPFGKLVMFELIFGFVFGFVSIIVSILADIIYNDVWLYWINKGVREKS